MAKKVSAFRAVFLLLTLLKAVTKSNKMKEILIFGGNGFVGSAVTVSLLKAGHQITWLSRGNAYFDSDSRISQFVSKQVICDCHKSLLLECKELFVNETFYDVVVDCSSFKPSHIKEKLSALHKRIGYYIFTSSETVYDASAKNHTRPSKESEAKRPLTPNVRLEMKNKFSYGYDKLECEEFLQREKKFEVPYLNVRLPLIIGPRDTSFRWWFYQLWVLTHDVIHYPVHIPDNVRSYYFSMVHVDDIADVFSKIVSTDSQKRVKNKAVNFAMREHITLPIVVNYIASFYGLDDVKYNTDNTSTWYVYPAGTKGPLDISLAEELLEWNPMPWKQAAHTTCEFYHNAMVKEKYVKEKEHILLDMLDTIVADEYFEAFLQKLKQIFGEKVLEGVDLDIWLPEKALRIDSEKKENISAENVSRVVEEL